MAPPPRQVVLDGKRLSRFMDSIYLDRPCEKLTVKKIEVLNAARRPLLERQEIGSVNSRVRSALADGVRASGGRRVLEWGCGYHPMRSLLGDLHYAGVDVDGAVVEANRRSDPGAEYHQADRDLRSIENETFDAVVSAFVFHFRLPRLHLATMYRALKPGGIVLANVYRRSPRSRRELEAAFEAAGLRVWRAEDAEQVCVDHEIWCMTRPRARSDDRGAAEKRAAEVLETVGQSLAGGTSSV
jgi:SAM-dependent methyltransferase